MQLTLEEEIKQALQEAIMLETASENFDRARVLDTTQRLSLAPFSFVQMVADQVLPV